ncbi:TonB-dependent receptor [Kineobactrum salinum]|uniref:TonB-dependent receptor n=1 Tax=Kineobactrum salinum TaxID=2708301 RepID=A0A6C0U3W9_9GAMM|nr:TonB-dependent receptor [Kineobactrum salinum]QIB66801.1 TonB-dependent receptor [Kineobactrum salinum]
MKAALFRNSLCAGGVAIGVLIATLPEVALGQARYSAQDAIEEVMVTARKREEGLQDAPISITAVTGDGLEYRGVDKIDGLADFTPNLTFQSNPGDGGSSASAAIYIRGVGQSDFAPTVEPGVGLYVDGVYIARSVGAVLDLVDVERIEVLRGPQGTLFGRNTIGGAISVTTKKPDEIFSGYVDVTAGTDDRHDIKLSMNVPLGETLFSRVSLASFNRDGYVIRSADGRDLGDDDTLSGHLAFRWLANENLELNLSVEGSRDRENGAALVVTDILGPEDPGYMASFMALNNVLATGDPVSCFSAENLNNPACYNSRFIGAGDMRNDGTAPHFSDVDLWGVTLTVDWMVGALSLKSITAYRDLDSTFARDGDDSPLLIGNLYDELEQDQFTQEFQLLGDLFDSRLEWILGAFYLSENANNLNLLEFTPADFKSGGEVESESLAVFGQVDYALTDQLSLTLGLRYTKDEKTFIPDQVIERVNVPSFIFPFPAGTPILPAVEATNKINEVTPMVNLSYQWSEQLMAYASYSEGFKSGGFTQRVFPPEPTIPAFDPEFVEVYELGFKFSAPGNRLRINGALFHTQYDDMQIFITNTTRVGPFIENAGEAEINGGSWRSLRFRRPAGCLRRASATWIPNSRSWSPVRPSHWTTSLPGSPNGLLMALSPKTLTSRVGERWCRALTGPTARLSLTMHRTHRSWSRMDII